MLDKDKNRDVIIVLTYLFEKGDLDRYHQNNSTMITDLYGKIGQPLVAMQEANKRGLIEEQYDQRGPCVRLTSYGEMAIRKVLGKSE